MTKALLAALASVAAIHCTTSTHAFELYDATFYSNKPTTAATVFTPVTVLDDHQLWRGKADQSIPKRELVVEALRAIPKDRLLVIDVENWDTTGPSVGETIERFKSLVSMIRELRPDLHIGLYSTIPRRDYWRAIGARGEAARKDWQAENDHLAPLVKSLDALFPCAYTFYTDQDGWKRYAAAQIAEARRVAPDLPVYIFLWPEYHDSTKLRGTEISPDFWKAQLQLACELADGAVIWGGWDYSNKVVRAWNENAAWWLATRDFARRASSCPARAR